MKLFLDYASAKYYAGEPIISDEEFDKLAEYHGYESVGAPVVGDRIAHAFPMWSLQKCYDDEPLIALPGMTVTTPKLDGAAVALYYVYGKLSLAITRGDGKEGQDITDKMFMLAPDTIKSTEPLLQITGEVVAPKTVENARNYAAGALNLKSVEEFHSRALTFISYGMKPYKYDCWSEDLSYLHDNGFHTVMDSEWEEYPHDGSVYRLNDYEKFDELGYTSKHPRGAFALKERKGGVVTKLLDVDWQVGRSGIVSPVALLEPVVIGEATVSRATLHNIKYIRELDLEVGCLVEVVRSGEIIPRIVRRIYE
jgi:NAD-dependent DNA ligase